MIDLHPWSELQILKLCLCGTFDCSYTVMGEELCEDEAEDLPQEGTLVWEDDSLQMTPPQPTDCIHHSPDINSNGL